MFSGPRILRPTVEDGSPAAYARDVANDDERAVPAVDPLAAFRRPDVKGDPPVARVVRTIDWGIGLAEQLLLFFLLGFLVVVSLLWFLTENFTDHPLENASYDIRYSVFLMAMVGGAFATHHRRLLSMDIISRLVSPRVRAWVRVATTTFAFSMAMLFAKYGLYIYETTSREKNTAHWMPAIAATSAMLLGTFLIAVHLLLHTIIDLDYLFRGKVPPEPEGGAA